ncbi:aquaporin, partial [Yersinia enterocolitica]
WGLGMVTAGYGLGDRAIAGFTPVLAVGMWCAGELSVGECLGGIVAQLAGSVAAAGMLYLLVSPIPSFDVHQGFTGNGYAELSPGGFSLSSVLLAEAVMSAFVVCLALGARAAGHDFFVVAGGCLALVVMLTVTLDNAAVSPARSLAMALFAGGEWLGQVWVFWVGPLAGAALGGLIHRHTVYRTQ